MSMMQCNIGSENRSFSMTQSFPVCIVRGLLLPMLMLGSTLTPEAEAATSVTIDPGGYSLIGPTNVPRTVGPAAPALDDGSYPIEVGIKNFPNVPCTLSAGTVTLAAGETRATTDGLTIVINSLSRN